VSEKHRKINRKKGEKYPCRYDTLRPRSPYETKSKNRKEENK
jgi:hypothetical protein